MLRRYPDAPLRKTSMIRNYANPKLYSDVIAPQPNNNQKVCSRHHTITDGLPVFDSLCGVIGPCGQILVTLPEFEPARSVRLPRSQHRSTAAAMRTCGFILSIDSYHPAFFAFSAFSAAPCRALYSRGLSNALFVVPLSRCLKLGLAHIPTWLSRAFFSAALYWSSTAPNSAPDLASYMVASPAFNISSPTSFLKNHWRT